jgi:predicted NAD-dependent protein-ADP-ribosyltransferase YbiA (DUF1768 family)
MPGRIDSFRGDHAFLSNFFESPIKFEGDVYPTVEHAFQAAKTFDAEERAKVRDAEVGQGKETLGDAPCRLLHAWGASYDSRNPRGLT